MLCNHIDSRNLQKEIASKGGQASSGSFEPGSEKAKEAGRKVVLLRRYSNEGIPTNSRKMLVTGKREDVVMIHERSKAGVRSPIAAINLLSFPKNNLLRYYLKFPHEKVH